jgi:tetratricopeptide (TPR) repeat protein
MSLEQRIRRQQMMRRVEGYLELGMPRHALEVLESCIDPQALDGHAVYLRGEALRSLERYAEAVSWLQKAAERMPDEIHVLLALGWCHKRTGRLDLAIEALTQALKIDAGEAIIHYNLACYWSLAGNKRHVLKHLSRALEMDAKYRDLVHDEPDFTPMRDDPDFQSLTSVVV